MQQPKYNKTQRVQWYLAVEKDGLSVKSVCQTFGVSRKTYYKWSSHDHGQGDPAYQPRRLQRHAKLTPEVQRFLTRQKQLYNYGPLRMKWVAERELGLKVSTTIIYRFFKRRGLIRKPQKQYPWYAPMTQPLLITRPGEGVQLDVKYVYGQGQRAYQCSVFDPYTEQYHFTIFSTKASRNAVVALERAEAYFRFPIRSVQTDNGSEFRGEFHLWLEKRGTPHFFIPKKSPYWNGQVERVHRTVDDEYYQNPGRPWSTVYEWLDWYNTARVHTSLKGKTPLEMTASTLKSVTLDC